MKVFSIKIINPDTNKPVSVEEWKKEVNPERADWVLIETDELKPFRLHKKLARRGKLMTFDEALEAGNKLTVAQGLALYKARYASHLNAILALISGDEVSGYIWTCEEDVDPQSNATPAWYVSLDYGYVRYSTKTYGLQVRLVSAFES